MTFIDTLLTYARAGYPAVALVSHEESRVLGELARAAEQAEPTLTDVALTRLRKNKLETLAAQAESISGRAALTGEDRRRIRRLPVEPSLPVAEEASA